MSNHRRSSDRMLGSQMNPGIRRSSFTSRYTNPKTYLVSTGQRPRSYRTSTYDGIKDNFKRVVPLLLFFVLLISGYTFWFSLVGYKLVLQHDQRMRSLFLQQTDAFNYVGDAARNIFHLEPEHFALNFSSIHISNTREMLKHQEDKGSAKEYLQNRLDEQYPILDKEVKISMAKIKELNDIMSNFTRTNLNSIEALCEVASGGTTEHFPQMRSSSDSTSVQLSDPYSTLDRLISWHRNVKHDISTAIRNAKQSIQVLKSIKTELSKVSLMRVQFNKVDVERKVDLLRHHQEYEQYLTTCWLGGLLCRCPKIPRPSASATRRLHDFDDRQFDPKDSLLARSSTEAIEAIQEAKQDLENSAIKFKEILSRLKTVKFYCADKRNEVDCFEVAKLSSYNLQTILQNLEVHNRISQQHITPLSRELCSRAGDEQSLAWEACMYKLIAE